MKSSIVLVAAAFLCLVAFPTTALGKNPRLFWPKPIQGWPNPLEVSRFQSTSHKFNYGDSKVWKCTYSNGSAPAISITPSIPFTPSPSTPSPSPPTPKTSPPPPTPSPPPPTPKKSPPPSSPSPPPPTPKKSPSPPPPTPKKSPSPPPSSPSLPPPAPKKSPSPPPPTPSLPPPTPKKSPSPPRPTPSLPPPAPKKSPSPPPPSDDMSSSPSQPFNPHPEHHHSHRHHQSRWEHIGSCMSNMGPVGVCRGQMEFSFFTKMFQVSDYCCNLIVNMKNECDDVIWGYFTDPFFVPLVRCTCHVTY